MKRLLVLLCLVMAPAYANVEICNNETCVDYGEEQVLSVETTRTPYIGVNIKLKNGYTKYMEAYKNTEAVDMLWSAYESLGEYHGWSESYIKRMVRQQDKAGLGVYGDL